VRVENPPAAKLYAGQSLQFWEENIWVDEIQCSLKAVLDEHRFDTSMGYAGEGRLRSGCNKILEGRFDPE
jgi:hypothetical protein